MGFNRGEIRVKATNISVMDRKGGKSILGCRIMSGAITATASAHSHLGSRVGICLEILCTPLCRGLGAIRGGLLGMLKIRGMKRRRKRTVN